MPDTYLMHLRAKGKSNVYIIDTKRLSNRIVNDCRFYSLRDINRDAVEEWLVQRHDEGMAARTRNSYLQALHGFCNWCVETHRMPTNPLSRIKKANEKADRRRQRRAMNESELSSLLYVARWRPLAEYGRLTDQKAKADIRGKRDTWKAQPLTFDNLDAAVERAKDRLKDNPAFITKLNRRGRERTLIYKTLVLTGLRRKELASLTVGHLYLDVPMPYIALKAADEKKSGRIRNTITP